MNMAASTYIVPVIFLDLPLKRLIITYAIMPNINPLAMLYDKSIIIMAKNAGIASG